MGAKNVTDRFRFVLSHLFLGRFRGGKRCYGNRAEVRRAQHPIIDCRIGRIRSLAPGVDRIGDMPGACSCLDRVGVGAISISGVFHHDRPTVSYCSFVRDKLASEEAR